MVRTRSRPARQRLSRFLAAATAAALTVGGLIASTTTAEAADAEIAVNGGFEAGTRTYADVLSAIEHRYSAQTDYALARYNFLVDSLKLKQDAGMLLTVDLARINDMLEFDSQDVPPPDAAAATPAPPATP